MTIAIRRAVGIWGIAAGTVGAVLASPAMAASAAAGCEIEKLPLPMPARVSAVTEGDPSGRWLGGYLVDGPDGEAFDQALLWHDGALVPFDPAIDLPVIKGISRRGVVVGLGNTASGEVRTFAYHAGATVLLAEPEGASYAVVTGVSASGTVAGYGNTPGADPFAVTWSLEHPDDVTLLPLPSRTTYSMAQGVSGHGQVAVDARMPSNRSRIFVFDRNGKRIELHGLTDRSSLETRSISNGWLVAYERDGSDADDAYFVRFDLRNDTVERVPLGSSVNADGTLGGQIGEDAALYTDEVIALPSLDDVPNGASVAVVDNAGQPAGEAGASAADASVAVRWRCG